MITSSHPSVRCQVVTRSWPYVHRALAFVAALVLGLAHAVAPTAEVPAGKPDQPVTIRISPGGWGAAQPQDIQQLLSTVVRDLEVHLGALPKRVLLIQHSEETPITLFKPGHQGECVIKLTSSDLLWAQFSYQFAHELGHVFANYDEKKDSVGPNQWFEETLCETASLFALRKMMVTWKTVPPYPNWTTYAPHLGTYAEEIMRRPTRQLSPGTTVDQWFFLHKEQLRRSGTERELNGVIANVLLPMLEADPSRWETVRFLNLGEDERANSFAAYLASWRDRVPRKHRAFIMELLTLFGYPAEVTVVRAREL